MTASVFSKIYDLLWHLLGSSYSLWLIIWYTHTLTFSVTRVSSRRAPGKNRKTVMKKPNLCSLRRYLYTRRFPYFVLIWAILWLYECADIAKFSAVGKLLMWLDSNFWWLWKVALFRVCENLVLARSHTTLNLHIHYMYIKSSVKFYIQVIKFLH